MPPYPYILMLCHIAKFKINRIILNTRPHQIQWSWIYLWIQWPRVYYCSFISSLPGPKIPWADFGVWPRHEGQDHLPACSSCFHTKGWFLMGVANWWVQIKHEWNTTSWFLNFMLGTWWLSNTGRKSWPVHGIVQTVYVKWVHGLWWWWRPMWRWWAIQVRTCGVP